jgi:hypothetical protein
MESRFVKPVERMIKKAKNYVEKDYDGRFPQERKWMEASLDSYETKEHRVTTFVREGSPCKGIIVADYGKGMVTAIRANGRIRRFHAIDYMGD